MTPGNALAGCMLLFMAGLLPAQAQILEVGPGKPYGTIVEAAQQAGPGDTILVAPGSHPGGGYISGLKGQPGAWITLRGAGADPVTVLGGNNALQLSDPAWLVIENFRFREQTGNGLNIDDGGTFDTPALHIHIRSCLFEDMAVSGNNDLLKLSGLDSFLVEDCHFENGATGGSGIDMVGCHHGVIRNNRFDNLGSNSIQAKGGTRYISIHGNTFRNGGQRTLNLGGSTGAAFFRPPGANYEAADLDVYSNVISGSWAAVAYVGSQRVRVWNNTIYQPENWVLRILQESQDTSFYQAAAFGEFVNNIIVVTSSLSTAANVGPNTNAGSFIFSHNLWYHQDNPNWFGPTLPAGQTASILQQDPLFENPLADDFRLQSGSPAIGSGLTLPSPAWKDHSGHDFLDPPSRGAFEGGIPNDIEESANLPECECFPNPAHGFLQCVGQDIEFLEILDGSGHSVASNPKGQTFLDLKGLTSGLYVLRIQMLDGRTRTIPVLVHQP